MSEKLENNIRVLKVELQAADKIIKHLKKHPQCPDCGGRMTRVQWECQDGSGWQAGWLCNCETNAHGRRIRPNDGTERRLPPPQSNDNKQTANGGSRSLQ